MKYLLDTNVYIHAMKNVGSVRRNLQRRSVGEVATSAVTLAELLYGAEKTSNPDKSRAAWVAVLEPYAVLDFDSSSAVEHARIRYLLRQNPIGERDLLIASIAISNDLIVVTNNTQEFGRVPGLECEDWY